MYWDRNINSQEFTKLALFMSNIFTRLWYIYINESRFESRSHLLHLLSFIVFQMHWRLPLIEKLALLIFDQPIYRSYQYQNLAYCQFSFLQFFTFTFYLNLPNSLLKIVIRWPLLVLAFIWLLAKQITAYQPCRWQTEIISL